MEKITWDELVNICVKHNADNYVVHQFGDKNPLTCAVCYKQSSFSKPLTEEERTYEFRSDNKYFIPSLSGMSIYGDCMDKKDLSVRLDWYQWDKWQIEYCYIED